MLILGKVTEHYELESKSFNISIINRKFYLINYITYGHEDPKSDPIIKYNENGMYKYLWRDRHFADFEYQPQMLETSKKLNLNERIQYLFANYQLLRYGQSATLRPNNNGFFYKHYYLAIVYEIRYYEGSLTNRSQN